MVDFIPETIARERARRRKPPEVPEEPRGEIGGGRPAWKSRAGWVIAPTEHWYTIYSPEGKEYRPVGRAVSSAIPSDVATQFAIMTSPEPAIPKGRQLWKHTPEGDVYVGEVGGIEPPVEPLMELLIEPPIEPIEPALLLERIYPEMFEPTAYYGYTPEEIPTMVADVLSGWAEEDPEGFLEDLISRGRTPDTETLLEAFGATPEDIDEIFIPPPEVAVVSEPQQLVATVEGIRKLVTVMPSGIAYDNKGYRVGSYNPITRQVDTLPEESKAKDMWDAAKLSAVSLWHRSKQYFVSTVPNLLFRDMTSLERAIQGDEWANVTDAHNEELRDKFRVVYAKNEAEFEEFIEKNPELQPRIEYQEGVLEHPELLKDPWYYAYEISSALPFMIGVMGTTLVTTMATGNPIIGLAAGAAVATPAQSQDVYEAVLEHGGSEEQATALAVPIGVAISAVEVLGSLPFFKAVAPQLFRFFRKEATEEIAKRTVSSLIKKGIKTAATVELAETLEEVIQGAMQNAAVKVVNEHQDIFEGLTDTAIRAAIATMPFALVGGTASVRIEARKRFETELPTQWDEEIVKAYAEGLTLEEAELRAEEIIAETPEGRKITGEIIDEISKVPVVEKIPEVVPIEAPERIVYEEGGVPVAPEETIAQGVADNIPILQDIGAKERVRPTRKVFERLGLYETYKGIQKAEVELGEARVAFNRRLGEVSKLVDNNRRNLVFRELENPGTVVGLTFNEKRAVNFFKENFDKWADILNLPQEKRLKNYVTHIFEADIAQQLKEKHPIDPAIARALEYKTPKTIFNPFLQKRLGATVGLVEDPFAAASAYESRQLKVFYYEPFLQKVAAIANDKNQPRSVRDYLKDYTRRMTGEPSKLDLAINTDLQELAEKLRGLPGGEPLANFLSRGNPSGWAGYQFTSAIYTLWLGFKPTSAIRNISQHTLIIGEVGPVNFADGLRMRFTKEGKQALSESLVLRSRKAAFVPGIDDSFATQWADKFRETALWMFRMADKQNVSDAFLAGYVEAKRLLPEADRQLWIDRGDEVAADTQYLYTKMNSMAISQSSMGRVFSILTTWMENWIELMSKWIARRPSQVYLQHEKITGEKVAVTPWSQSYKAIGMYMLIIGLGFAIKEKTRLKAWEYTGLTSVRYLADIAGGDFPGLQYIGAAANLIAGFVTDDERRMKAGLSQLNPVKMAGILRQLEGVAIGDKDWMTLLFYLEGRDWKLKQLKDKWEKEFRDYPLFKDKKGEYDPELRLEYIRTHPKQAGWSDAKIRSQWRIDNPLIEAKMFVVSQFTTLSTDKARAEVLRLIEAHKLNTEFIDGYEKVFGVDTDEELSKFKKRIGMLEKLVVDEEAEYFTVSNYVSEVNRLVKIQGRTKVDQDGSPFTVEILRAQDSFVQYESLEEADARTLFRQQFPDIEALLYMTGRIQSFENPKSAEILLGLMKKYGIPPEGIRAFVDKPERYDELFTQKFKLEQQWFDLSTEYENYSNSESPLYIEDKDERQLAREKLKEENPNWVADMRRIEAIDHEAPPEIIEKWAERGRTIDEFSAGSSEAMVWLLDNPDTFKWALDQKLLTDDGSDWNVPVLRINAKWRESDERYDAFTPLSASDAIAHIERAKDGHIPVKGVIIDSWNQKWLDNYDFILGVIEKNKTGEASKADIAKAIAILREDIKLDEPLGGWEKWKRAEEAKGIVFGEDVIFIHEEMVKGYWGVISLLSRDVVGRRADYLDKNPEYRKARRRREAYGDEFPDGQIENFVNYYELPVGGFRQERYLIDNPEFATAMHDIRGIDLPDPKKVPAVQYDEIYEKWQTDFDKLDGFSDHESPHYIEDTEARDKARETMRFKAGKLTDFGKAEIRREAYGKIVPYKHIESYVGYYSIIAEGKPEKLELWYEDDWFMMEHQDFYKEVYRNLLRNERLDFRNVPTREVYALYQKYLDLPKGKRRLDYRYDNSDLDAWLVLKFDMVSAVDQKRREELTPTEEFYGEIWEREKKFKESLEEIERKLKELVD